jgi:hypothetical protein
MSIPNYGIPKYILKRMLPKDSIKNTEEGFVIKALNVMSPFTIDEIPDAIERLFYFKVDGELIKVDNISLKVGEKVFAVTNAKTIIGETLPMGSVLELRITGKHLTKGKHVFEITVTPPDDPEIKINFEYDIS